MKKKGMLLASETLKLVIAVISIGFLIYLLSAIYFSIKYNEDKVQADATLERLGEVMNRVSLGEVVSEPVTEITPFGWTIFAFTDEEKKPNFCAGENCLCICDEVFSEFGGFLRDRQLEECSEEGSCLVFSSLAEFGDIEIEGKNSPTSLIVEKKGDLIEVKKI